VQQAVITNNADAREILIDTLTNDDTFKDKVTYGDREMAEAVLQDMVGMGMIPEILRIHPHTTDINFNGTFLTVDTGDPRKGKIRYARINDPMLEKNNSMRDLPIITNDYILSILNKFAVKEDAGFSRSNPLLNGFSGDIRVSGNNENTSSVGVTMSLRISHPRLELNGSNWTSYAPLSVRDLLFASVTAKQNLVISGSTGTGKTTLLKYLVDPVPSTDRIIMIEDVAETQLKTLFPYKDIMSWLTSIHHNYETGHDSGVRIIDLVQQALRNYPTWILVSETRGAEAYELYQAMLTGHSIMTTVHAVSNQAMPSRFKNMMKMEYDLDDKEIEEDLLTYMSLGVHVIRKNYPNGQTLRYPDEIVYLDVNHPDGQHVLFKQKIEQDGDQMVRMYQQFEIPAELRESLLFENNWKDKDLDELWVPTIGEIKEVLN
jgi:Flp pilus assembly protein, ATPase CpaF